MHPNDLTYLAMRQNLQWAKDRVEQTVVKDQIPYNNPNSPNYLGQDWYFRKIREEVDQFQKRSG